MQGAAELVGLVGSRKSARIWNIPSGHFKLTKQETVGVELKFGAALPNTVTVVAYAEFESVIEFDRIRNVIYAFSS